MTAGPKYIRTLSHRPPPWTVRHDLIVRTLHPTLAAEKLGVVVELVKKRRKFLRLPTVSDQFTDPKATGGWGGFTA
jgi:hypothetical protein